jgi:1,2-diacylglycerol 3-alpha-glucosyltransferase
VKVAVLWVHFGPYHLARLKALGRHVEVLPVELASGHKVSGWQGDSGDSGLLRVHAGPYEDASHAQLMRVLWGKLRELSPDVLLIPGYREPAALAAAAWGRLHGRKNVLMSDSVALESHGNVLRERLKGMLVSKLFQAAIVSGCRARAYLTSLGMRASQIARGYDVVDNDYFENESARARATRGAGDF